MDAKGLKNLLKHLVKTTVKINLTLIQYCALFLRIVLHFWNYKLAPLTVSLKIVPQDKSTDFSFLGELWNSFKEL